MENRDVNSEEELSEENMAEAAVISPPRFFCHRCTLEISPVLPDFICPQCQSGFIEELAQNNDLVEPMHSDDLDEDAYYRESAEDEDMLSQVNDLWSLLSHLRRPANQVMVSRRTPAQSMRPGPSRRQRFSNRPPTRRGQVQDLSMIQTDGFLRQLVTSINDTGLVPNTTFPVFLNLHSNPGDYAWGRGGWNAIITQLINQLDGTGPPPMPRDKIDEIPFVNISQDQVDKSLQCTVCMEDFKLDESVRRLTCDHHFHTGCITPWLELHGTCPICRKLLTDGATQSDPPPTNDRNDFGAGTSDANVQDSGYSAASSVYDFTEEFD